MQETGPQPGAEVSVADCRGGPAGFARFGGNPWAAEHYALLRSALEDSGTPMGNLDLMIAAQALAAGRLIEGERRRRKRARAGWRKAWRRLERAAT